MSFYDRRCTCAVTALLGLTLGGLWQAKAVTGPLIMSPESVTLTAGQKQTFALTGTSPGEVATWTVNGITGGNAQIGTITSAGVYQAPAQIGTGSNVLVIAFVGQFLGKAVVTLAPSSIQVTVAPTSVTLSPGVTQQFTANVSGTPNAQLRWTLAPTVGTISSSGLYTSPTSVPLPQTVTVTAMSAADTTKSASARITVQPAVTISVSPRSGTLGPGQSQQFTATVGGTSNTAVKWSISPPLGTISPTGLYLSPSSLSTAQTVTVTAISAADPSKTASASLLVGPAVTVSVSPTRGTVIYGRTQQFLAAVGGTSNTAVTWAVNPPVGTISPAGLYAAPGAGSTAQSVVVTAKSVADPTKSAAATLSLVVPLTITSTSLPGGTSGTPFTANLAASGGALPYSWSITAGQLPAGLTLSTTTGTISGAPTTVGTYNVGVRVSDSTGQQATQALVLVVVAAVCTGCPPPSITTTNLPDGLIGVPYSATLAATSGTTPYTWSIASGQLPPGLSLSTAGMISGTPSTTGSYSFTISMRDSSSVPFNLTKALGISVTTAPQTDQYGGLMTLNSPSGSTGKWAVEKYTVAGTQRWMITTPAGHGFWCAAQYGLGIPGNIAGGANLNAAGTAKYNSRTNWEAAALARYAGWGFNCIAEYPDTLLINDMTAGTLGATKLPYWREAHIPLYAMNHNQFSTEQTVPADAVKNLALLIYPAIPYTHWIADAFDPTFGPYVQGLMAYSLSYNATHYGDGYAKSLTSPYMIGMFADDQDFQNGFGPGPDDCASMDGVYHPNIAWVALSAPMNAYVQWQNTGNVYDNSNWFFNNPAVASKQNLVSYLKNKYGNNIAALNTAWNTGGYYTAFDSAATRYTGETVGTTDGVVSSLSHTLSHASGISPGTVLIKVGGSPMASDFPQNPGTIIGRWPDGSTALAGTINYSTGLLTLGSKSAGTLTVTAPSPASTSWGTINLGHTNITQDILVMRLEPVDCRMNVYDLVSDAFNCLNAGGPYTISGSLNRSTGVISNLTISPAVPPGASVRFEFQWSTPLPNVCGTGGTSPCTVTVDYDVNGWGVGTALADENGSTSHTWLGDRNLAKPNNPGGLTPTASLGAWADLNAWLYNYTDQYLTNTVDVMRSVFHNNSLDKLFIQSVGGHHGCPRKPMAQAVAAHADILSLGQIEQPIINLLSSWGLSDFPIIDSWEGIGAQADSAGPPNGWNNVAQDNYPTQAQRGAAMATRINNALTLRTGSAYQSVGIQFWEYTDTFDSPGVATNYGLVTPSDNAYDGHENVQGNVACSAPLQAYSCGGERYTWAPGSNGDAITPIKAALTLLWNAIAGAR